MIDLGDTYHIDKIVFMPAQTESYIIETSVDNVNWIERTSNSIPYYSNTLQTINYAGFNARYIRYRGINDQVAYVGVVEFEVYGN